MTLPVSLRSITSFNTFRWLSSYSSGTKSIRTVTQWSCGQPTMTPPISPRLAVPIGLAITLRYARKTVREQDEASYETIAQELGLKVP